MPGPEARNVRKNYTVFFNSPADELIANSVKDSNVPMYFTNLRQTLCYK